MTRPRPPIRKIVAEAAAQPKPSPRWRELAQMAAWRLSHIEWLQSTDAKLAGFVGTPGAPPPSHSAAPAESPG